MRANPPAGRDGVIISHHGSSFAVEDGAGVIHRCTARRKVGTLVCGDEVMWQPGAHGDDVIVALRPRRTALVRPDSRGTLKAIAANVDQLLIVTAPPPGTPADTGLLDRYLVAGELCGLGAALLFNKTDLLDPPARSETERALAVYQAIGYPVLFTSAKRGLGLAQLVGMLKDRTSVLVGPSGVGKSSLAQALLPEREIRIGAVSEAGGGRHTTTLATLYHLPDSGRLIDSPGVRDFRLWQAAPAEIARGFVEFRDHARSCRFTDCLHLAEPGCAVRQAVEGGEIAGARYKSYRVLVGRLEDSKA